MGEFRKKLRDDGCHVHQTEPYTPWSDRAELAIRELKRKTRKQMMKSHSPKRFWDDCLESMADINSHTVHENYELDGQTPQAMLTGITPDISTLAEFGWYQWVKCFDEDANLASDQEKYARNEKSARFSPYFFKDVDRFTWSLYDVECHHHPQNAQNC
jgi:hypothetical protein